MQSKPRLAIVTTVPMSLDKLLRGQLAYLQQTFEVTAVSAPGEEMPVVRDREGVRVVAVPMVRRPAPLQDLRTLVHLIRVFRRLRPDIVHAYTPKAGLLGMLAARLVGVPIRVRSINGLPLMEATGGTRRLLAGMDRLSIWVATDVLANSEGLRRFVQEHLTSGRVGMIGAGSTNGVDTQRFSPAYDGAPTSASVRSDLGVPADATLLLAVGRLVRDKGITELVDAFDRLLGRHPGLYLVLAGPREADDSLPSRTLRRITGSPNIVETGLVDDIRPLLIAADILVHPSYREGMPNVVLEAAGMEVPIVATDIPGCRDVLAHDRTGLLVPPKDSAALAEAIGRLIERPELRDELATAARRSVSERYDQGRFWEALNTFYRTLLHE